MSAPRGLHRLSRLHGIQTAYYDNEGRRVGASPDALMATLRALGVQVERAVDLPGQLVHREQQLEDRAVEPVEVVWVPDGQTEAAGHIRVRVPARLQDASIRVRVELESGGERVGQQEPGSLVGGVTAGDGRAVERTVPIPAVPMGYHTLTAEVGTGRARRRYEALLIAAPATAAGWDVLPGYRAGKQPWGLFAPLYGLWAKGRGLRPDYGLLGDFARRATAAGASVVGTLPLLAAFLDRPYEPSPYAPVSRMFWNEVYVSGAGAPIAEGAAGANPPPERPDDHWGRCGLAVDRAFDAAATMAVRRPALEAAARSFWMDGDNADDEARIGLDLGAPEAMAPFLAEHPQAEDYARFRALTEARGPWPGWPARLRARDVRSGDFDTAVARYHLYGQWRAHQELAWATERAAGAGVGLYLDLPLGVHPAGYDTWRERTLFAHDATAGAPPDPLAPGGQNWGFPPVVPERSRLQGHRYFIACIRQHLRFASVLRIDHVMQLHRMFWIATGDAREGVYVRYPARELYAILCLESRRAGAVVVGEDLGTVPRRTRQTMRRRDVPGMYVLQFELRETIAPMVEEGRTASSRAGPEVNPLAPGLEPKPVRAGALAAIGTHDTPTFAGWWWGEDVRLRAASGQLTEEELAVELAGRGEMRRKLARGLGIGAEARGRSPSGVGAEEEEARPESGREDETEARAVYRELLRRLGASDAGLVLAAVEDLWLEREPQNVPGTESSQNWSRRLAQPLDALADPVFAELLEALDEARTESGKEGT